jgi:hypothetical protein
MSLQNVHDFEPTMVRYAGMPKRGFKIVCGHCRAEHKEAINSAKGFRTRGDESDLMRIAARKFTDLGWQIGKRAKEDRCPKCKPQPPALTVVPTPPPAPVYSIAPGDRDLRVVGDHNFNAPKGDTMRKNVDMTIIPVPLEEPRQMGREDRRLVFEKINEVYDKDRYTGDWTDKKIAEDLGCPRAWVASVRDEMFGPEGGNEVIFAEIEATKKVIAEAQKALDAGAEIKTQAQVLLDRANAVARETAPLHDRMQTLTVRLRELEKMLR